MVLPNTKTNKPVATRSASACRARRRAACSARAGSSSPCSCSARARRIMGTAHEVRSLARDFAAPGHRIRTPICTAHGLHACGKPCEFRRQRPRARCATTRRNREPRCRRPARHAQQQQTACGAPNPARRAPPTCPGGPARCTRRSRTARTRPRASPARPASRPRHRAAGAGRAGSIMGAQLYHACGVRNAVSRSCQLRVPQPSAAAPAIATRYRKYAVLAGAHRHFVGRHNPVPPWRQKKIGYRMMRDVPGTSVVMPPRKT